MDGYKALAHGVDLSVASNFLDDFTPLGYALINQEITVISILSGCMVVGGWLAGGGANGFVNSMSNSVQGTLTGGATSAVAGKVTSASKAVGEKALLPAVAKTAGAVVSGVGLAYGAAQTVSAMRNVNSGSQAASSSSQNTPQSANSWKLPEKGKT